MIIWLNGPFGAGKTTVTHALLHKNAGVVAFDTELLGYALRPALARAFPVDDFQEWPAWRHLVVETLTQIVRSRVGDVIVPQTVVVEEFWSEMTGGLAERGVDVCAVTLHVDPDEHLRRIEADMLSRPADDVGRGPAAAWRRARRADYEAARPWLRTRTQVIDTTTVTPDDVAERVMRVARG